MNYQNKGEGVWLISVICIYCVFVFICIYLSINNYKYINIKHVAIDTQIISNVNREWRHILC